MCVHWKVRSTSKKAEEMFDFNESSRQDFEDGQKHIKDEISKIEENW